MAKERLTIDEAFAGVPRQFSVTNDGIIHAMPARDALLIVFTDFGSGTFNNEGTGPNEWPFDKAFYVKLNIAVGGSWGGQKGIDDTIFPQQFLIDYVRVYQ